MTRSQLPREPTVNAAARWLDGEVLERRVAVSATQTRIIEDLAPRRVAGGATSVKPTDAHVGVDAR